MELDPTRIEPTIAALQRAWEGQPDLTLPTLFAMLANQGIGWGTDDADLVDALNRMAAVHPPALPLEEGRPKNAWLVQTDGARVTLAGGRVIVRGTGQRAGTQPVVWTLSAVRPTGPGRPLVVADEDGFEHRLGVVEKVSLMPDQASDVDLAGLKRRDMGDRVFVVRLDCDGSPATAVVDHGLQLFARENRSVRREKLAWTRIQECRPGESLVVDSPGGVTHDLGVVRDIFLAEDAVSWN